MFRLIRRHLGAARLFTVGIGPAPSSHFMCEAARAGRGSFSHIGTESQISARIGELLQQLSRPVLTDIQARFDGPEVAEIWPAPIPDLYAGEPVVFLARLAPSSLRLKVRADLAGRSWARDVDLYNTVAGTGIAKLWAREKIAGLETRRLEGAGDEALRRDIVALGLEHELVTRHTALVAVEVTASRPADAPLVSGKVPLNLPAGWEYDKVRTGVPIQQCAALAATAVAALSPAPSTGTTAPTIALPATATPAPWHRTLGAPLLIAA